MTEVSPLENVSSPETELQRGIAAHRSGDLAEAERQYLSVLALDDKHFRALHLLGLVHSRRGDLETAERLIRASLDINPDSADAHYNCGNVLLAAGRFEAALESYENAIRLKADYADAYCNRGIALFELGRFEDACASYEQAIAHNPSHFLAYSNRGNALFELGRFAEALVSHEQALAINPNYVEAYSNRGNVLMQLGQHQEAFASYQKMIALKPQSAEVHHNCGLALNALGRVAEAVASYDSAIALNPNYADAYTSRGNAVLALAQPDQALANYEAAVALKPQSAEAHYNRAIALVSLKRFDEGIASYDSALALNPSYLEAVNNRAAALVEMGRREQALASYQDLVARWPDDAGGHMNEGILRLLMGDFRQGWPKYESRRKAGSVAAREYREPAWSGEEDLAGRTILLYGEQGLGDVIQFCRYVPLVARRASRVILEVPSSLKPLIESLDGVEIVVGEGEPRPNFDLHCSLLSLPLAFATDLSTIPAGVPYLSAPKAALEKWSELLPRTDAPRIGIVWAGNPNHRNDHNRSIGLQDLRPLFELTDVRFVSLQKELGAGDLDKLQASPRVVHCGESITSFLDTAAIVSLLDLVITVDTSVAHLAGALGKPVWVLLPFAPDWRWLLDRNDSPWYPTARLFRQARPGDWAGVIDHVIARLSALA
jgi:tetratricopeptide (TPR) repeat protein